MRLPETIRVKLSSEAAEYVSITPVLTQQMRIEELIEVMLDLTGKNVERIHELLLRGSYVSGASRYRWEGWDADKSALQAVLDTFPDADDSRPFAPERCVRALVKGRGRQIEVPRESASARRLLSKSSFWDALMSLSVECPPRYFEYSYKDRADVYRMMISSQAVKRLLEGLPLLKSSALEEQLRRISVEAVEFHVHRDPA